MVNQSSYPIQYTSMSQRTPKAIINSFSHNQLQRVFTYLRILVVMLSVMILNGLRSPILYDPCCIQLPHHANQIFQIIICHSSINIYHSSLITTVVCMKSSAARLYSGFKNMLSRYSFLESTQSFLGTNSTRFHGEIT